MFIRQALPALALLLISPVLWSATETVDPGLAEGGTAFGRHNQVVLDGGGSPVLVFADPGSVYLLRCNDAACGGGDDAARRIASTAESPALALDDSGFPLITYFDRADDEIKLVHCNDPVCRDDNEHVASVSASGAISSGFSDVVLDGAGNPVIAFEDEVNDELRLVHCNDESCQGGDDAPETVTSPAPGPISLVLDGSGNPVMAFKAGTSLALARCNDTDCSGGGESVHTVDTDGDTGFDPVLELDDTGNPVIGYWTSGGDVKLAHCNDADCDPAVNGAESVSLVAPGGAFSGMSLDSAGRPGLTYEDGDLQFVQCNDVNCTGGDELSSTLSPAGFETSLTRDAGGNPVITSFQSNFFGDGPNVTTCNDSLCQGNDETVNQITDIKLDVGTHMSFARQGTDFLYAYRDETNGTLRFRRCDDFACNDPGDTLEVVDDSVDAGRFTDLALDPGGLPFITYYDADNGNLKVADCDNAACSSATLTVVDGGGGDVGQYPDTVFDDSGRPVISYFDVESANGNLKVAHCANSSCASLSNSINTADPDITGSVGLHTSIVLDASGFPVIAYHDETEGTLRLSHCNDVNCASDVNGFPSREIVDTGTSGPVGLFTDLRLDASGYPVISYFDGDAGHLKLAHCNDGDCSGSDESIVTVDDGGGQLAVGQHTSLALDDSGNPVVGYYNITTGDLRVAQCNDPDCAASDDNLLNAETTGDVGQYASLVLEGANVFIAHYDETEQQAVVTDLTLPEFLDFGDAPTADQSGFTSDYPTALPTGARHADAGATLGSERDTEVDGQATANANGDDTVAIDDEESITFTINPATNTTVTVEVVVSESAQLDAWFDFNADGDWTDGGEQVFTSEPVNGGTNVLSIDFPADAVEGTTFARFRVSASGGLPTTGFVDNGEVEDYAVTILDGDNDNDGMSNRFENEHELDPEDPSDADDDEDKDGLDNLDEFNAGTDPNDPDSDGDFLGDALDDDPAVSSNECTEDSSGDAIFDGNVPAATTLQCGATNSITVDATATIDAGAGRLELISPTVMFENTFSVPEGAELDVRATDPTPP